MQFITAILMSRDAQLLAGVFPESDTVFLCETCILGLIQFLFHSQKAVRILFSPMVSTWVGRRLDNCLGLGKKILSRLYLRNCKM